MKKAMIRKYARLIAECGINVQKDQDVIIYAELDQPEFCLMVAKECYALGARKVTMEWSHQPFTKLYRKKTSLSAMSEVADWEVEKKKLQVATLPACIYIESEDPDGLNGVSQVKVSKAMQARYPIFKPLRDAMENRYQWCICAVPGKAWAKKVFPDLPTGKAVEKLWEAILMTSRADGDNPVDAWAKHNRELTKRCDFLNGLGIDSLTYKSANGTDFTVGLLDGTVFMGGAEKTLSRGVRFNPNIPSEEIFISPKKGVAEGVVVATKPLSYRGELIENFSVRFHEGKAVEVHAEKGEALLKEMIAMDEGAAYLGECALIPYDSPIRNSGILFYNTLFDENASCHLALGMGFTNVLKDCANLTTEECYKKGINDSMIHVDFMIGSADLSIDAKTRDGKVVPIFREGNWVK